MSGLHASQARTACAVRSAPLRSKGSAPHPRQNVGMPPSRFCRSSSHLMPAAAARRVSSSGSRLRSASKRPRRVVCVRHAARQRRPRPGARSGAGVGMFGPGLLREQPGAQPGARRSVEMLREAAAAVEGLDRQGRHPRGQVRIDRPAAILPHGGAQEVESQPDDGVVALAGGDERHGDETGERRRLQESAVRGCSVASTFSARVVAAFRIARVIGLRDGRRR